MKNKKTTVISSIAACAVLVSFFVFSSNASISGSKAAENSSRPAEAAALNTGAAKEQTPVSAAVDIVFKTLEGTAAAGNNQPQNTVLNTGGKSGDAKVLNLSTSIIKNSQNCPRTKSAKRSNNQQNNATSIKSKLEDMIKSYFGSLSAKLNNKSNCSKTASAKPVLSKPATAKPAAKPATGTAKPAGTTKPAPSATNGNYSSFQKKVVDLVNAERARAGLKPLKLNTELSKVATLKSQDMAKNNYFDHNSPTYGSPFDMMKKFGISYRTAGENIAMGQTSPEQVMQGWMNSPGHRANILKSSYTQIGVGIARNSSGRLYWTQQFIG